MAIVIAIVIATATAIVVGPETIHLWLYRYHYHYHYHYRCWLGQFGRTCYNLLMQFRRRTGTIIVVLILLTYAGALQMLRPCSLMDARPVEAQGYPAPSATHAAYPPPAVPTATLHPTNTPPRGTPSPTVRQAPSILPTPATPTLRSATSPTATAVTGSVTPTATSTSDVVIVLPPTVTRRAPAATLGPIQQQAAPATAQAVTVTTTRTEEPVPTPTAESDLPSADLLPPVANRQSGPGVLFTLLAGAVVAALAWWIWKKWLASGADAMPENPEEPR
ncbi:MAG: hypothetical protein ACE5HA_04195 [Anaerolineae bacterium]